MTASKGRLHAVLADLDAEGEQLSAWVLPLAPAQWAALTPAEGWTIGHQIAHLCWTDEVSLIAATDPDALRGVVARAMGDPTGFVDAAAEELAAVAPEDLLARWARSRAALSQALHAVPGGTEIPWFGPPMSATSMATARLMETWAHAHDVAEALGIAPEPSSRAKHVAYLGVRTRDFAYQVRGKTPPDAEFRVELTGPDGDLWAWGPKDAAERVTGSGHDFALLATRRRHVGDVDVKADGDDASYWLTIVQAFAGLPGNDPRSRGSDPQPRGNDPQPRGSAA